MSWIQEIDENDAEGKLKGIYDDIIKTRGKVSNIMRVQSLATGAMQGHMDLYLQVMFKRPGLSRAEREMVATYVSRLNGCSYCMDHHGVALLNYWKDQARLDILKTGNVEELDLSTREMALLDYADTLTRSPGAMMEMYVEALRAAGLKEAEILNLNMVVSYFNFVNRIAVGLGVEHSEEEMSGYKV